MKIKSFTLILVSIFFISLCSFKIAGDGKKAEKGTYQFVIRDNKKQSVFTDDILYMVEAKRQEHQSVTLPLSATVYIFIPSKDAISSKDFKPLEEVLYQ